MLDVFKSSMCTMRWRRTLLANKKLQLLFFVINIGTHDTTGFLRQQWNRIMFFFCLNILNFKFELFWPDLTDVHYVPKWQNHSHHRILHENIPRTYVAQMSWNILLWWPFVTSHLTLICACHDTDAKAPHSCNDRLCFDRTKTYHQLSYHRFLITNYLRLCTFDTWPEDLLKKSLYTHYNLLIEPFRLLPRNGAWFGR